MPQRVHRSNSDASLYGSDSSYEPSDMSASSNIQKSKQTSSDSSLTSNFQQKQPKKQENQLITKKKSLKFASSFRIISSPAASDDDFQSPPERIERLPSAAQQQRILDDISRQNNR